jgi:carbon monoxide dehydrogenase subunit G
MVHIEGETTINRPVDAVFDVVADERNEPSYNPNLRRVEQLTSGPIGPGTRFRAETTRMDRPVEMVIEITAFERPRRLTSTTHLSNMDIHGAVTFDPVPEGTRMHWSWDVEPRGPLRLMGPAIAWVGQRQEEAIWSGLKTYLEGGHNVVA